MSTPLEIAIHREWEEAYLESTSDFDDVRRGAYRALQKRRWWDLGICKGCGKKKKPDDTYHLNFDGLDDGILISGSASLNNLPLNDFTVEFVGTMPNSDAGEVISKTDVNWFGWDVYVYLGKVAFSISFNNYNDGIYISSVLADNDLHHWEFVWLHDSVDAKIFKDGIEVIYAAPINVWAAGDFLTDLGSLYDDAPMNLGIKTAPSHVGETTAGTLNWLRFSNIVRHTSNFTPPSLIICPPVDANTILRLALDEGTGTIASDTSGNDNSGVITGATWEKD